jgi:hypothetical protein
MHQTQIVKLGSAFLVSGFLLLGACGPSPVPSSTPTHTPAPPATATTDLCSPGNLLLGLKPVNDLMLQFDDYATLAQRSDKSKLTLIIPNMQTIRRVAQDRNVPPCLRVLRRHQIAYMDATLTTLLEFQKPNPAAAAIATGIVDAQYFHQEYALELARVLGVTLTPLSPTPAAIATP